MEDVQDMTEVIAMTGIYLMASLLEAFMISVAEGTPIRLNLIPYKKQKQK